MERRRVTRKCVLGSVDVEVEARVVEDGEDARAASLGCGRRRCRRELRVKESMW